MGLGGLRPVDMVAGEGAREVVVQRTMKRGRRAPLMHGFNFFPLVAIYGREVMSPLYKLSFMICFDVHLNC